jgi:DnaJ-class molecular chaperone
MIIFALIINRFRRLSLKFHPLRNPTDLATNTYRFNEICEAYDVLSNCNNAYVITVTVERKSWFDKYGEYGLKEGVPGPQGGTVGGYRYAGNSFEIFDRFFGTTNPFAERLDDDGKDQYGSLLGDAFGG